MSKTQQSCTVLWRAAAPCGSCGTFTSNPHIQAGETLNLLCAACCPDCKDRFRPHDPVETATVQVVERDENGRTLRVVTSEEVVV